MNQTYFEWYELDVDVIEWVNSIEIQLHWLIRTLYNINL